MITKVSFPFAGPTIRALVADDDPTTRAALGRILTKLAGCDTTAVTNGRAVLEQLEETVIDQPEDDPFSLVLLDVNMPILGGIETLERIRASAHPRIRDLPVVMLTGERDEAVVSRAVELGIRDYLIKPLNPALTMRRLRRLLRAISSEAA